MKREDAEAVVEAVGAMLIAGQDMTPEERFAVVGVVRLLATIAIDCRRIAEALETLPDQMRAAVHVGIRGDGPPAGF